MDLKGSYIATSMALQDAFSRLQGVVPPSITDSPGTRQAFDNLVNTLTDASSEAVKLSIGLANFSVDDDGEPLDLRLDLTSWSRS